MKLDVVLDERLGVVDLSTSFLDEVIELGELEVGRALGRKRRNAGLEDTARLEQRDQRVVVHLQNEVDRLGEELRRRAS